jgi:microcystin-dependent protein
MVYRFSKTAATNASADGTINFAEGQPPSSLNDSSRALMARVAQYRDDISGAILTTGTGAAYAVSSNQVFTSLAAINGQMIAFSPHATNTGAATLSVDGLSANLIRMSPGVDLPSNTLILGTPYVCVYSNTDSVYYLQGGFTNPYGIPLSGMIDYIATVAPNSCFAFPIGQAISRATYSALFSAVGTTYGAGDGSTTFNIIDMRGRVSVAADGGSGNMPGVGLNTPGGIPGASSVIALSQIPNYAPAFTGTQGVLNVSTLSTSVAFGPFVVSVQLGASGYNVVSGGSQVPSTGVFTPSGSVGSINGGQSQVALNTAMPYRGVNKILRII